MSKHNNVNPDHYKTKGRSRPGDDLLQEQNKQLLTREEKQSRPGPPAARQQQQKGAGSKQRQDGSEPKEAEGTESGR